MIKKAKKFQVRITHKSFGALMRAKPHALREGRLGLQRIKMAAILYSRLCVRNSGRLGRNTSFFYRKT